MTEKLNKKEILVNTLPSLGQLAIIIIIILLFRPNILILTGLLLSFNLCSRVYQAAKKDFVLKQNQTWDRQLIKSSTTLMVVIGILWSINYFFGGYGWAALIITSLLIGGYILYNKKDEFMKILRGVEVELYGATREEIRDRRKKE